MRASQVDQCPPLIPGAKGPKTLRLFVHVIVGRIIRQHKVVRPQAGDGSDLAINVLGLGIVRNPKGDGIVVGRRFEIAMTLGSINPVL